MHFMTFYKAPYKPMKRSPKEEFDPKRHFSKLKKATLHFSLRLGGLTPATSWEVWLEGPHLHWPRGRSIRQREGAMAMPYGELSEALKGLDSMLSGDLEGFGSCEFQVKKFEKADSSPGAKTSKRLGCTSRLLSRWPHATRNPLRDPCQMGVDRDSRHWRLC